MIGQQHRDYANGGEDLHRKEVMGWEQSRYKVRHGVLALENLPPCPRTFTVGFPRIYGGEGGQTRPLSKAPISAEARKFPLKRKKLGM